MKFGLASYLNDPEVMRYQRCHTEVVELWKSRRSDRELLQRQTREDDQGQEVKRSTKGAGGLWKEGPFCLGGNGDDYI